MKPAKFRDFCILCYKIARMMRYGNESYFVFASKEDRVRDRVAPEESLNQRSNSSGRWIERYYVTVVARIVGISFFVHDRISSGIVTAYL